MVIRNAVRKGYQEEDAEAGKKEKKGFVESGWREEGGVQVRISFSSPNILSSPPIHIGHTFKVQFGKDKG